MENIVLETPIKPGFRRPFTITTDEDVEGVKFDTIEGDSTGTIDTQNTKGSTIKGWINGDGVLGNKEVELSADGHIGEGEARIAMRFQYNVAHPDATAFGQPVFGPDELIPDAPAPAPTPEPEAPANP